MTNLPIIFVVEDSPAFSALMKACENGPPTAGQIVRISQEELESLQKDVFFLPGPDDPMEESEEFVNRLDEEDWPDNMKEKLYGSS